MKVKIGTLFFKIKYVDRDEIDGPEVKDYMGRYNTRNGRILVLDELDKARKRTTFWHEVIHIIADQHNLELTEGQIDALTYGIDQVLQDNKRLT